MTTWQELERKYVKLKQTKDPAWLGIRKLNLSLSETAAAYYLSRYRATCPGCASRRYTQPKAMPLCGECWRKLPIKAALWWWRSKQTQRSLEMLLDEYFDGGFQVEPDYLQVKGKPR